MGGVGTKRKKIRIKLHEKQHGECHYCRRQTKLPTLGQQVCESNTATLDHILPFSNGGGMHEENLVVACYECNHKRGCKMKHPITGENIKPPANYHPNTKRAKKKKNKENTKKVILTMKFKTKAGLYCLAAGLLLLMPIVSCAITSFVMDVRWEQNVSGHIKRAADSNTPELAVQELKTANDYLEANNITHGYTSIIYNTPHNDVGFWYTNLKQSQWQLDILLKNEKATQGEKDMVLLKLRQTLLDHSQQGERVTQPDGIKFYPYNRFFMVCCSLGVLLIIPSIILIVLSWGCLLSIYTFRSEEK